MRPNWLRCPRGGSAVSLRVLSGVEVAFSNVQEPEATFPWGPGLRRLKVAALFSGRVDLASPYVRPEGHVRAREPAHWTPTPEGQ